VSRQHFWDSRRHRNASRPEHASIPRELPVGPLADRKSQPGGTPGHRVPVASENECAHLLANEARATLHLFGLGDGETLELAEDFIAEDRGGDTMDFEGWAMCEQRAVTAGSPVE
jgi:hypothetical protein